MPTPYARAVAVIATLPAHMLLFCSRSQSVACRGKGMLGHGGQGNQPSPLPTGPTRGVHTCPNMHWAKAGARSRVVKTGWGKRVVLAMGDLHFSNEGQMPVSTARDREARTLTRVERAAGVLFNAGSTGRWGMVCVRGDLTDEAGMR
jgi:hypothetical protein